MKSIKITLMVIFTAVLLHAGAQTEFKKVKSVKNIKATVKVLNENMTVLVPDAEPNQRYTAAELPAELKKDGLHLTICGDLGEIPANVRMIGTPFKITCISITKAEQKKYKLSKRSYCIK